MTPYSGIAGWQPSRRPYQDLDEGILRLTLADPGAAATVGWAQRCWELLEPHERQRHSSFRYTQHQHEYLVTRVLARTELSRYAAIPPEALRFVSNAYGRPEVEPPDGAWLRFNLSNTAGLVACAVARGCDVGVDAENTVTSRGDPLQLAERFFAPGEFRELRALPPARRHRRFFEYWTLKEAYLKARGLGLTVPLDSFTFRIEAGGAVRVDFDAALGDSEKVWKFWLLRPTCQHQLAVALRWEDGQRRALLRTAWATPL